MSWERVGGVFEGTGESVRVIGVTEMVRDEVLEEILQMPVAEARGKMVDEVNRMGAEDNATFIIAEII